MMRKSISPDRPAAPIEVGDALALLRELVHRRALRDDTGEEVEPIGCADATAARSRAKAATCSRDAPARYR